MINRIDNDSETGTGVARIMETSPKAEAMLGARHYRLQRAERVMQTGSAPKAGKFDPSNPLAMRGADGSRGTVGQHINAVNAAKRERTNTVVTGVASAATATVLAAESKRATSRIGKVGTRAGAVMFGVGAIADGFRLLTGKSMFGGSPAPGAHLNDAAKAKAAATPSAPSAPRAVATPTPQGGQKQTYAKLDGTTVEATDAQARKWQSQRK